MEILLIQKNISIKKICSFNLKKKLKNIYLKKIILLLLEILILYLKKLMFIITKNMKMMLYIDWR